MKYSCITHVLEVSYSNEILFSAWLFLCNTSAFYYSINSLATRISFLNKFMKSKHKRTIKYQTDSKKYLTNITRVQSDA